MSRTSRRSSAHLATSSFLALLCAAPAAVAAPAEPTVAFSIPAGTMESALTAYAIQAHVQLLYTPDLVAGRRSAGLAGALTVREALGRLLSGTGLVAQESRPGVIVLRMGGAAALDAAAAEGAASTLSEVVVTGTHIRGADTGASPIVQLTRDAIDRQGFATVADALAALPQNFSGLASPDVTAVGLDVTSNNYAKATGVNLRGLGPGATLVLVNGRRMAGTGGKGDFADVSAIPTAVVDHVDILLDGASALYGSDAVGGVVNIILKRDYEGAESRLLLGAARGGGEQVSAAQTLGHSWSGGSALVGYEYYRQNALPFAARDYAASADLRPFGGTDHRSASASPGNVLILNPITNASVPTYAISSGATTFPLAPGDFRLGQVNLTSPRQGMDLLPTQERNSLYAALTQTITDRIEASADLRFSQRNTGSASLAPTATLSVTRANPNFASPNGAASQQMAYSFIDDLGPTHAFASSRSLGASVGATVRLGGDWRAEAYGAYAQERISAGTDGNLNSLFLREALGATADNPATPFRTSVDGFFNPYGSGNANSRAVLDFIGSGYSRQRFKSQVEAFNLEADGTIWRAPGGDLKLAIGASVRRETFDQRQENQLSTATPTVTLSPTEQRTVSAAFVELRAPLVGPDNALPGVRRLDLSLAGRIESYDDAGETRDPKIGLTWEPAEGLRLRGTYGTSFRAPGLVELNLARTLSAFTFTSDGQRYLVLDIDGGNPNLRPESARTWTLGLDWSPARIAGLRLSASLFDTDFKDEIDRPVSRLITVSAHNPVIAPFVQFLNPANPADIARVQSLLNDPAYTSPGLYPANAFGLIVDTGFVNTGRLNVRGLDMSAAYGFDRGGDRFDLAISGAYLLRYAQQITPTAPTGDFVGHAGQPVALRARASGTWTRDAWGATVGLNYVSATKADTGQRISDWTTFDAQLRWTPRTRRLQGLSLALSVQNLFDAEPPFYDSPQGVGYDAANADPLGRFAALQLGRRW